MVKNITDMRRFNFFGKRYRKCCGVIILINNKSYCHKSDSSFLRNTNLMNHFIFIFNIKYFLKKHLK